MGTNTRATTARQYDKQNTCPDRKWAHLTGIICCDISGTGGNLDIIVWQSVGNVETYIAWRRTVPTGASGTGLLDLEFRPIVLAKDDEVRLVGANNFHGWLSLLEEARGGT